jgi:hypothetical protein
MRLLKVLGGLAVTSILLSGCGGGSASSTSSSLSSISSSSSSGSATVSWTAPTTYTNGTPLSLSALQGFHVHYGTAPGALGQEVTVPSASADTYTVSGLPAGTWYFAVSAYTSSGESGLSAVQSKTIS